MSELNGRNISMRSRWRMLLLLLTILGAFVFSYLVWSPGRIVRDGSHDLRTNGIWIQHGWLGDDAWFQRNNKDKTLFRNDQRIQELADCLASHGVKYVFPHVCPCEPNGKIAFVDPIQTERFLDHFEKFAVLPWIGGVLDVQCSPKSSQWRTRAVSQKAERG